MDAIQSINKNKIFFAVKLSKTFSKEFSNSGPFFLCIIALSGFIVWGAFT
jgi:hypothetical protein